MDDSEVVHFYKTDTPDNCESKKIECQIYLPHFTDKPTKAQIGQVICTR